jgi:GUN4-like
MTNIGKERLTVAECPVCQNQYLEGHVNYCSRCGWYLIPHPIANDGQNVSPLLQHDRNRLEWARQWWWRSQSHSVEMRSKLEQVQLERDFLQVDLAKLQVERSQLLNRLSEFYDHAFDSETELERRLKIEARQYRAARTIAIDYTPLQNYLARQQWQEADQETAVLMLNICDRHREGWLRINDISDFPISELQKIDQFWTKYSNGRFGFSVQQRLWRQLGGTLDAKYETWCGFGEQVGWYQQGAWISYDHLCFDLDAVPGHLPAAYCELGLGTERLYYWWWSMPVVLFTHFDTAS